MKGGGVSFDKSANLPCLFVPCLFSLSNVVMASTWALLYESPLLFNFPCFLLTYKLFQIIRTKPLFFLCNTNDCMQLIAFDMTFSFAVMIAAFY